MNKISLLTKKSIQHVEKFIDTVTVHMGKVSTHFTRDMVFGMLGSGSCHLSEIGRGINDYTKLLYTEKRLSRNIIKEHEDYAELKLSVQGMMASRVEKDTVISVDLGDLVKSHARKMEHLSYVHDGDKKQTALGYQLLHIIGYGKDGALIPLEQELFSTRAEGYKSENDALMKSITQVYAQTEGRGIFVLDRGGDRKDNILIPLERLSASFVVPCVGTRDVIPMSGKHKGTPQRLAAVAHAVRAGKHQVMMNYQGKKLFARVGYTRIRIPKMGKEYTLVVLKKYNGDVGMMLLTSLPVHSIEDALFVCDCYGKRWVVEDTYRFLKQGFQLEQLVLRSYKALKNFMIFLLTAFAFLAHIQHTFSLVPLKKEIILHVKELFDPPKYACYSLLKGLKSLFSATSHPFRIPTKHIPEPLYTPPRQLTLFLLT